MCNIIYIIFLLVTHHSLTPRFFSTRLDGYSSQHGESFQSHNKQNINNVFRPIFNITSLETHSESNKPKKWQALKKEATNKNQRKNWERKRLSGCDFHC